MPKVYFVIGSYYGGAKLRALVDTIHQDASADADYAVVVNEQAGPKRTPSGFAAIHNPLINAAAADPNCKYIWVVGDDVSPDDCTTFVGPMRYMDEHADIGAVFPVEHWHEDGRNVTIKPFTGEKYEFTPESMTKDPEAIPQIFAGFACVCIHAEAWRAVGPLDQWLGRGYTEDLDWGIRCWKAGWKIVNYRHAAFGHERGGTFNRLVKEELFDAQEPYQAADRIKFRWPFLWRDKDQDILARLQGWRAAAQAKIQGIEFYNRVAAVNPQLYKLLVDLREDGHRWQTKLAAILQSMKPLPKVIVETGVYAATSTNAILRALWRNQKGMLYSIEPYPFPGLTNIQYPLWKLVTKPSIHAIPEIYYDTGPWDVFIHDSDHEVECQTFEFEAGFHCLKPGGFLIADDTTWGSPQHHAWDKFIERHALKAQELGDARIVQKPTGVPAPANVQVVVANAMKLAHEAAIAYGHTPKYWRLEDDER